MADVGELEGGDVRVSDRDRYRVVEELRVHCADGRITVEELERRIEQAMAALTVHELALTVCDLPATRVAAEPPERSPSVRIGPPGLRPFTMRIVVPASLQRTRNVALDTIAPALNGLGYELRYQSPDRLDFRRGPKERVAIGFEQDGSDRTTLIVHGRASRKVRKAFARLSFT